MYVSCQYKRGNTELFRYQNNLAACSTKPEIRLHSHAVYKTHIRKIQVKQNHIVRLIFFAKSFGSETEKAKPLLNLLGLLTVNNIYCLQVLKFLHSWHKGLLPEVFDNMFQYASNIHGYNTRYAAKHNLYKPNVRTNVGKQLISFMATDIWKDLPTPLKKLIQSVFAFPKQIIHYLLSEQRMN